MTIKIIRLIFILACIIMGLIWARYVIGIMNEEVIFPEKPIAEFPWIVLGGAIGGGISILVLILLSFVTQEIFERFFPALVAIMIAMLMGYVIGQYIIQVFFPDTETNLRVFIIATLVLIFGFSGIFLGLTRASNWETLVQKVNKKQVQIGTPKLLDTSVIIDGRILDICDSGFLEGTLMLPRFVLRELQNIADSADEIRRAKGRRGLDILKEIQNKSDKVFVTVIEDDPPNIREVDSKLLQLARDYGAKILTNDYNLNKVAQIEKIQVLNINDLANALKPVVLPDEHMEVKIIKEGKEPLQGVGYLDDGTMIVVDGGKDYLGKNVSVIVTSVLQTAAGRMIFGKFGGLLQ